MSVSYAFLLSLYKKTQWCLTASRTNGHRTFPDCSTSMAVSPKLPLNLPPQPTTLPDCTVKATPMALFVSPFAPPLMENSVASECRYHLPQNSSATVFTAATFRHAKDQITDGLDAIQLALVSFGIPSIPRQLFLRQWTTFLSAPKIRRDPSALPIIRGI